MAITTTSDIVGNAVASPQNLSSSPHAGGALRVAVATIEIAASTDFNATTDYLHIVDLPSGARVHDIVDDGDAIGTAVTADFGIFETDGTIKDGSAFGNNVTITSANGTSAYGAVGIDNLNDALWEHATGYADQQSAPSMLSLMASYATGTAGTGTLVVTVTYSTG